MSINSLNSSAFDYKTTSNIISKAQHIFAQSDDAMHPRILELENVLNSHGDRSLLDSMAGIRKVDNRYYIQLHRPSEKSKERNRNPNFGLMGPLLDAGFRPTRELFMESID